MDTKNIGEAWLAIMGEVGYVQKQGVNKAQNYRYAGEVQLIEALRPALIKHGVICVPSQATSRSDMVVVDGKKTYRTVIDYLFTYTHVASGTSLQVAAIGEGVDMGDKAAYKAATGALKYALRQPFLIETGDEPEAHDIIEVPAKPVFQNAALRKTFCENVIKAFASATTENELTELVKMYAPKFKEMDAGSEHDQLGVGELRTRYAAAVARIKDEQESIAFRANGMAEQLTPRQ